MMFCQLSCRYKDASCAALTLVRAVHWLRPECKPVPATALTKQPPTADLPATLRCSARCASTAALSPADIQQCGHSVHGHNSALPARAQKLLHSMSAIPPLLHAIRETTRAAWCAAEKEHGVLPKALHAALAPHPSTPRAAPGIECPAAAPRAPEPEV